MIVNLGFHIGIYKKNVIKSKQLIAIYERYGILFTRACIQNRAKIEMTSESIIHVAIVKIKTARKFTKKSITLLVNV